MNLDKISVKLEKSQPYASCVIYAAKCPSPGGVFQQELLGAATHLIVTSLYHRGSGVNITVIMKWQIQRSTMAKESYNYMTGDLYNYSLRLLSHLCLPRHDKTFTGFPSTQFYAHFRLSHWGKVMEFFKACLKCFLEKCKIKTHLPNKLWHSKQQRVALKFQLSQWNES